MLKIIFSITALLLLSGCGSGSEKKSSSTTPSISEEPVQGNAPATPLSNIQKLNQATKELDLKLTSFSNNLNITTKEESIQFKGTSYILENKDNKKALISLGSSEFENFEKKESLVINTNISQLPILEHGYRNILIKTETSVTEIRLELEEIFNKQGTSIISYILDDIDETASIEIRGENTIYTCTNKTTTDVFERVIDENSHLSLPSEVEGHYVCFDEKGNKVFDYNLTFESIDILGVKYNYNPNTSEGASLNIYTIINNKIDIQSLEESLKESGSIKEDVSLVLKVFYKNTLNNNKVKKEVFKDTITILSEGEYDIFYTITSPQNQSINISKQLSIGISAKVLPAKLTPN